MGEYSLADDVLFVGHSLVGTEIPVMLEDVVRAQGGSGEVVFQVINGAPLAWNWDHSKEAQGIDARAELPKGDTEVVVMTEAIPLRNHTTWSASDQYALKFYQLAEHSGPGTRVFLYETWHSLDSGTGVEVPYDENGDIPWRKRLDLELPRWNGILEKVNAARGSGPEMRLIPAGQAMARMDDEIRAGRVPGLSNIRELFEDDIHPNDLGNYFVTMVQYAAIYGRDPRGLPRGLKNEWGAAFTAPSAALAATMQRIAWEVVSAQGREHAALAPILIDARYNPACAPAPTASEPSDPSLAMGLNGITDWSTEQPFLNIMKTARGWIGHLPGQWGGWDSKDLEEGGYLDANGWPKSIPPELDAIATVILTDQPEAARQMAGRYRITYAGKGRIELSGRVENIQARPSEIWFDYSPGGDQSLVILTLRSIDPIDPIRDIAVVRADQIPLFEAGAIFNPLWFNKIKTLRSVRFMDWMNTNNSPESRWQDRPRASDYSYSPQGAPVEIMVALANEAGVDPWFNMPHQATDDYVKSFAEYVRDHLDPKLKAHVEYSNEIWNWQFEQTEWAQARARARWGKDAPDDAWMQFAGLRAAEVAAIWTKTFGAEAPRRLDRVIATQTGWLGLEQPLLEAPLWVAEDPARNRPPATYFDSYAVTGYFNASLGEDAKAPLVKDWIAESAAQAASAATALGLTGAARDSYFAQHRYDTATAKAARELRDGSVTGAAENSLADLLGRTLPYQAEVARQHGLDLIMYEGGTHVVGTGTWVDDTELTAFFTWLNYTPAMGDLYKTLLTGWKDLGGTQFNAFVDVAGPGKWGSWGALRYLGDDNPRMRALTAYNRDIPAWWEDRPLGTFAHGETRIGTPGADILRGTAEEDILLGAEGDDLLLGLGNSDRLDGGPGTDIALLPGKSADYRFEPDADAVLAIGPGGTTRLRRVETLRFEGDPGQTLRASDLVSADLSPAPNRPTRRIRVAGPGL